MHSGARPARQSFCAGRAPRVAAAGRSTRALGAMNRVPLAIFVVSLSLTCCSAQPMSEPRPGRDLTVLRSPDGAFQAIVREVNIDGSVMVSQPYQVLLQSLIPDARGVEVVLTAD